ncbi:nucleoside diphosphate-linked moiety X motif 8 isoform X1 [Synchiropus splendidus]|uniref:nucleoside diphosphate-linked moiety X motif 8 isoform X1 n=2 Tax=Synchiropus splendidus TaxID=270530 RepID=UPI00237D975D|nr:nucleoside diphosphate-linked moiety X motif 8 isoform X1 [Synchiropus splendidus]
MMFGCHRIQWCYTRQLLLPTGCLKDSKHRTHLGIKDGTATMSSLREASSDFSPEESAYQDKTAKPTLVSSFWKSTFAENVNQVKPYRSRVSNVKCLQPPKPDLDGCKQLCGLVNKAGWMCFNVPPNCCTTFQQARCVHQAAPHLNNTWSDTLSLENENRCRLLLEPNLKLYEKSSQGKLASILVTLCCVGGEPAFLFTLRSSQLKGRHKGDVSFAGGKSDPADKDVVATAVREAREEIGVTVTTDQVWGVLKPLTDKAGTKVAPVLAYIGPIEKLCFKPNPGEVEEIFTLSLSHLCHPRNRGYTHFRMGDKYSHTLPVFRNGKHKVWGLTAVALSQTLKMITPS